MTTHFLALETSCDETAAAVFNDDLRVLSSVVASQNDLHGRFGGVVPEIASPRGVVSSAALAAPPFPELPGEFGVPAKIVNAPALVTLHTQLVRASEI